MIYPPRLRRTARLLQMQCRIYAPQAHQLQLLQHRRQSTATSAASQAPPTDNSQANQPSPDQPLPTSKLEEHVISLRPWQLQQGLTRLHQRQRPPLATGQADVSYLLRFAQALELINRVRMTGLWRKIQRDYAPFDPDAEAEQPRSLGSANARVQGFGAGKANLPAFMEDLMALVDSANMSPIPQEQVLSQLQSKVSFTGVKVQVDQSRYGFVKMWARGITPVRVGQSWRHRGLRIFRQIRGDLGGGEVPKQHFQRILVVCATKDNRLHIKLFKNVEDHKLELMLPDIRVGLSDFDRFVLYATIGAATLTSGWRLVSSMSANSYLSPLTGTATAILITASLVGIRLWAGLSNNRNRYTAEHNKMLFFHNMSDNRGALALLLERATEEEYAEALLAYYFLMATGRPLTKRGLSILVEDYLNEHHGIRTTFDVDDALKKIDDLGLITSRLPHVYFRQPAFTVLPLHEAVAKLEAITTRDLVDVQFKSTSKRPLEV